MEIIEATLFVCVFRVAWISRHIIRLSTLSCLFSHIWVQFIPFLLVALEVALPFNSDIREIYCYSIRRGGESGLFDRIH
jgi:hypothetical protein